jgi:hypothetical protein
MAAIGASKPDGRRKGMQTVHRGFDGRPRVGIASGNAWLASLLVIPGDARQCLAVSDAQITAMSPVVHRNDRNR